MAETQATEVHLQAFAPLAWSWTASLAVPWASLEEPLVRWPPPVAVEVLRLLRRPLLRAAVEAAAEAAAKVAADAVETAVEAAADADVEAAAEAIAATADEALLSSLLKLLLMCCCCCSRITEAVVAC